MKDFRNTLRLTIAVYALSFIGDVTGTILFHQVLAAPGSSNKMAETAENGDIKTVEVVDARGATDKKSFQTVSKDISMSALEKYKSIDISLQDPTVGDDKTKIKFSGVPLRTIVGDMVPGLKLESMPEIKTAAKLELVVEVKGADGYPALIPVGDIAINRLGDHFILATHRDGKLIEPGPQLICKMDEAKTRWVHEVVSLRVVGLRD